MSQPVESREEVQSYEVCDCCGCAVPGQEVVEVRYEGEVQHVCVECSFGESVVYVD